MESFQGSSDDERSLDTSRYVVLVGTVLMLQEIAKMGKRSGGNICLDEDITSWLSVVEGSNR
jgi:hypothetical protein